MDPEASIDHSSGNFEDHLVLEIPKQSCPPTAIKSLVLPCFLALLGGVAGADSDDADRAFGVMSSSPIFAEKALESGLSFSHFNGMTGKFYFPEMTGQGGGFFDYDNDGDLDVYLVQGSLLGEEDTLADALYPPEESQKLLDRLYRNDSFHRADGGLELKFVDVTSSSGIDASGYGMGVAVGDIDLDGWLDLYVTNYGPNRLYRNRGDGTFEDLTEVSGTGDPLWGASALFFDYDDDGDEDLYVVNYVEFDVEKNPRCFAASSRRDYCGPDAFDAQPDRLYKNLGVGRFEDVTTRVLSGYRAGPGLGVTTADFNGDGRVDIFVANDGSTNQLWINRGNGTFVDEALFAGVAVNRRGRPEASMGVTVDDYDGDGDEDIFLTHLMGETNTLYVNDGGGLFEDRTTDHGLAAMSLPYTSFGTSWIDVDNDGLLDLLIASGAVRILEDQAAAGDPFPLKQPSLLLGNTGSGFENWSELAGDSFSALGVGRGVSVGDIDNDGDADAMMHFNNAPVRLLENRIGAASHWIGVAVRKQEHGAFRTGTRIEVRSRSGATRWRTARTDGSYCSTRDSRILVGLGDEAAPVHLTLYTASGSRRVYSDLPPDRYFVVYDLRSG